MRFRFQTPDSRFQKVGRIFLLSALFAIVGLAQTPQNPTQKQDKPKSTGQDNRQPDQSDDTGSDPSEQKTESFIEEVTAESEE